MNEAVYSANAPRLKDAEKLQPFALLEVPTHDSVVAIIQADQLPPGCQNFVFKRRLTSDEKLYREMPYPFREKLAEQPLTKEKAFVLAKEAKQIYENAAFCLDGHVAKTLIAVGHPVDSSGQAKAELTTVQVFQEPVTTIEEWLESPLPLLMQCIRGRSINECFYPLRDIYFSEGDYTCKNVDRIIKRLREKLYSLGEYQKAFLQSILLGYIPDLISNRRKSGEEWEATDAGMIFSPNVGINSEGDFVFFDFDTPRADVLDIEARKRLKVLLDSKTESPIILERSSLYAGEIKIADWYKRALQKELQTSTKGRSSIGIRPNNYLEFLERSIKRWVEFDLSKERWIPASFEKDITPYWLADYSAVQVDDFHWIPANLAYEIWAFYKLTGENFFTIKGPEEKEPEGSFKPVSPLPKETPTDGLTNQFSTFPDSHPAAKANLGAQTLPIQEEPVNPFTFNREQESLIADILTLRSGDELVDTLLRIVLEDGSYSLTDWELEEKYLLDSVEGRNLHFLTQRNVKDILRFKRRALFSSQMDEKKEISEEMIFDLKLLFLDVPKSGLQIPPEKAKIFLERLGVLKALIEKDDQPQ